MARKVKADCRADTRGGPWAGIPVCVIQSAAYRDCSVYAKAILVELTARMNGYNNGKIAVSQRELAAALRCHPRRIVKGVVELFQHGLLDVTAEGKWKERQAREFRLTFVSTKTRSATNDYRHWQPGAFSGDSTVEPEKGKSDATVEPAPWEADSTVEPKRRSRARKTAISQNRADATVESLILSHGEGTGTGWWCADHMFSLQARWAVAAAAAVPTFAAAA